MASRQVVVQVQTEAREFPAGTEHTGFLFSLFNSLGEKVAEKPSAGTSVSFDAVPEANGYVARVSANGVTVTKTFDIPVSTVLLEVPVAVTVSF